MIQWLDEFYGDPELRSTLMESFLPAFSSYVSEAVGGPVAANFITALAESYVDRHLGSSRAQLQEVLKDDESLAALQARFDEWEEKRPTKVAKNELVRSANAAQVQQMREKGVTRKVWVASGGSCPYCTGLDGRTVAIEEAFFTPDDEYNPEGAESPMTFTSSIGHPPVHQGCDCSIAEEIETVPVEGRMAEAEAEIAGGETETLLIYDENGNVIRRIASDQHDFVEVSEADRALAKGHITAHNHPGGDAQSLQDFRMLLANGELESRVVTEEWVYRLRTTGTPTIAWDDPALTSAYERWKREAVELDTQRAAEAWGEWRQYVDGLPEGSPTGRRANPDLFDSISARARGSVGEIGHRVWTQASEDIPWLQYERLPRT